MWTIELLLFLELSLNLILLGLILTIQFVHYPLFHLVTNSSRFDYHQAHMRVITPLVAPLMVAELILTILISIISPKALVLARLILVLMIWGSTFLIQVPLHQKIAHSPHSSMILKQLVRTNWIRTLAWLFKAILGMIYFWEITRG
jgi:hypothetical protein